MYDPVPNQIYTIQNKLSPKRSVDISGASIEHHAKALIWDTHGLTNQRY